MAASLSTLLSILLGATVDYDMRSSPMPHDTPSGNAANLDAADAKPRSRASLRDHGAAYGCPWRRPMDILADERLPFGALAEAAHQCRSFMAVLRGQLKVVTPFHHLSEDSHANRSHRAGPITASNL
jgi:hypothetical protein